MADNIQTDSDSQGPIQPGVGRSDQTNKQLHQINPNWVEDGYGVVGPQRQVIPQSPVTPHPVKFGIDNSIQPNPALGAIVVTTEDTSGYTPGSGVPTVSDVTTLTFDQDLFEIFDGGGGQCVVKLKTTDCS